MGDDAHGIVTTARQLAANSNYKLAFDMYTLAIILNPKIKKKIQNEFRFALMKLNEELASLENKSQIFINFESAINIYPGNVELLNDIGGYLYRYSYFSEALCHFEKALNIDSSCVCIEKNLNNAKSFLFPRTKYRILNDKIRNDGYRAALRSCINPRSDSVIDIDAGTGLLALYANECNPITVTACESSKTMARLAECVMQENNALEVVIANKPFVASSQLGIYGSRAILLTDMFDAGLFGEYILQSLCHAWDQLLYKRSKIIPGKAEFFVVGVNCDELNSKYKLGKYAKDILNVSHMNVHTTTYYGETYYSEDVHLYKNMKYICEPQSLFTIDFNNRQEVSEMLNRQQPYFAELNPTADDEMNMVVGWFNLHLTEDITLTTDPREPNKSTAWQQAVFFDVIPRKVRPDVNVTIPFVTYNGKLTTLQEASTAIARISPETLAYLNDTEYMNMITKSIGVVCVHLAQTVMLEDADIVDLSPFPLFGILMMRRGANSLICHAKTKDDVSFIQTVLTANGIPEEKVTILVQDYWFHEVFKDRKFHVIFSNIIDFNGDIDVSRKRISQYLKQSHLQPNGMFLPESVTVMGQLIYSHNLEINNRVLDENVGYKLAKHVNKYQTSQSIYLEVARLEHDALSEEFEVAACDKMDSRLLKVPILKDGECNAILCWYKVQLLESWNALYTNRSNSFVSSMAYLNSSVMTVHKDDEANVLTCLDPDGSFKLVLDIEP